MNSYMQAYITDCYLHKYYSKTFLLHMFHNFCEGLQETSQLKSTFIMYPLMKISFLNSLATSATTVDIFFHIYILLVHKNSRYCYSSTEPPIPLWGILNNCLFTVLQSYSTVVLVIQVWDFLPQNVTPNQLDIHFVTLKQYWSCI